MKIQKGLGIGGWGLVPTPPHPQILFIHLRPSASICGSHFIMPFEFEHLAIPDVILVRAKRFSDDRGFFVETYKRDDFEANGILETFVQDNHSRSTLGVLRGLHYQRAPRAQGKLIQVLKGEIYDVAVDIRRGSPTYGQWTGIHLSEARSELLYVPPGFAHGFCVLSEVADFTYKCTDIYAPETYRGISWDDPDLGISWPIKNPILSRRDQNLPPLKDADNNFIY